MLTTKVTNTNLERDTDGSLGLASKVDREPSYDSRQSSVRSRRDKELSKVSDSGRWIGELDDETDDAEPLVDEEEKEALLPSVGQD